MIHLILLQAPPMPTTLGVNTSWYSCPQLWDPRCPPIRHEMVTPSSAAAGPLSQDAVPQALASRPDRGRPAPAHASPRHMSQPPPPARALDRAPASVLEVRASDTVFQAQSDQRQPQRGLVEHGPCKRILTRARRPDHNLTIERTSTLKDSDRRGENFLTAKGNRSSLNQKSGRSLAPGSSQVT